MQIGEWKSSGDGAPGTSLPAPIRSMEYGRSSLYTSCAVRIAGISHAGHSPENALDSKLHGTRHMVTPQRNSSSPWALIR